MHNFYTNNSYDSSRKNSLDEEYYKSSLVTYETILKNLGLLNSIDNECIIVNSIKHFLGKSTRILFFHKYNFNFLF